MDYLTVNAGVDLVDQVLNSKVTFQSANITNFDVAAGAMMVWHCEDQGEVWRAAQRTKIGTNDTNIGTAQTDISKQRRTT